MTAVRRVLPRIWMVVDGVFVACAALAVLALLAQIVVDTLWRGVTGSPLLVGGLDYITNWWMVSITFVGLYVAHKKDEHIVATVLLELQSPAWRRVWRATAGLLMLTVLAMLAYYGWESAQEKRELGEFGGASNAPAWPFRYLIPLGAGVTFISVVIVLFRGPKNENPPASITEPPAGTIGVQ